MYILAIIVLLFGISLFSFSHWAGRRKNVIDQLESDVRIFLALILIASFYVLFFTISAVYLVTLISEYDFNDVVTCLYFLFPLLLGLFLYVLSPWLCGRSLLLKTIPVPEHVQKIGDLLELKEFPQVCTTSLSIPPLVFGRRSRSSILVLPDNMESLLTEKEQEAVISHELSHIKQGDVGVFTWLMLLIEGLKYWILPLPVIMYFGMASYFFDMEEHPGSVCLVLVFFLSIILLRNSLSRTRESIADAYAVFHGCEAALKSALMKYAALRTIHKGSAVSLCFFHNTRFGSLFATHPPLKKRLHSIDEKTFLVESLTNLSPELAFWTGLVSAFLFYNFLYSVVGLLTIITFGSVPESVLGYTWVISCFLVMGVVGIPYIFPSTKGLTLVSDLVHPAFLLPLLRNWGITLLAAAGIIYGLTLDSDVFEIFLPSVAFGLFLWLVGFLGSKFSDFDEKMWFILFSPAFIFILVWYPVRIIYFIFSNSVIDLSHFAASVVVICLLTLIIFLILLETGYTSVDKERLILFFGKKIEISHSYAAFGILAVLITLSVPITVSLGVYAVSCFLDSFGILPEMSLFFVIIPILLYYGFKKMDILFFTDISFYVDILEGDIQKKETEFIQKVVEKYHSSDGGFDCAGLQFSKQKDTYYVVKTARTLGIEQESERIVEWIKSTETKGGFALISDGNPRVEGTYYAVKSLSTLGLLQEGSCAHTQWIRDSFNGKYFAFKDDSLPILVQTCCAVELLSFFGALERDITHCREWIRTHFSDNVKPREAFFATRVLIILGSDTELTEKWLIKNRNVLSTRVDKNIEAVYYYVKVLRELNKSIPEFITEQATNELKRIREKYSTSSFFR